MRSSCGVVVFTTVLLLDFQMFVAGYRRISPWTPAYVAWVAYGRRLTQASLEWTRSLGDTQAQFDTDCALGSQPDGCEKLLCASGQYITSFTIGWGAYSDAQSTVYTLSAQCSDGAELFQLGDSSKDANLNKLTMETVSKPDGFTTINGTGTDMVRSLLGQGSLTGAEFSDNCTSEGAKIVGYSGGTEDGIRLEVVKFACQIPTAAAPAPAPAPVTTTGTTASSSSSSGVVIGVAVGVSVGVVAILAVIAAFIFWKRRQKKSRLAPGNSKLMSYAPDMDQSQNNKELDSYVSAPVPPPSLPKHLSLGTSVGARRYEWGGDKIHTPAGCVSFGRMLAPKQMDVAMKMYDSRKAFEHERSFYTKGLSTEYFPEVVDFVEDGEKPAIIMTKAAYDAVQWLRKGNRRPSCHYVQGCLRNLCEALNCLHRHRIVHGDVKPGNIMWFTEDHKWKLTDFETWAQEGDQAPLQFSLAYAAPEVAEAIVNDLTSYTATIAVDMWSVGLVMWEMLTGEKMFTPDKYSQDDIRDMLTGSKQLPWEESESMWEVVKEEPARRLVMHLLERDPHKRWDTERVLKHSYFKTADDTSNINQAQQQKLLAEKAITENLKVVNGLMTSLNEVNQKLDSLHALSLKAAMQSAAAYTCVNVFFEELDVDVDGDEGDEEEEEDFDDAQEDAFSVVSYGAGNSDYGTVTSFFTPTKKNSKELKKQRSSLRYELYERYETGKIRCQKAALSLMSSSEDNPTVLVHQGSYYAIRFQISQGQDNIQLPLPYDSLKYVSIHPMDDKSDEVQLECYQLNEDATSWEGFVIWAPALHVSDSLRKGNGQQVDLGLTLALKMKDMSGQVSKITRTFSIRVHPNSHHFDLEHMKEQVTNMWEEAPEWVKLSAYSLKFFALGG